MNTNIYQLNPISQSLSQISFLLTLLILLFIFSLIFILGWKIGSAINSNKAKIEKLDEINDKMEERIRDLEEMGDVVQSIYELVVQQAKNKVGEVEGIESKEENSDTTSSAIGFRIDSNEDEYM